MKMPCESTSLFGYNRGNRGDYYRQFWELLEGLSFRLHWGKHLPRTRPGPWAEYLSHQYPRWKDFQDLREERSQSDFRD